MLVVFEAMSRRGGAVVDDDVLYRFRLRLFILAAKLGNVRAACRTMGVHPATYYRWRGPVLRAGLEMLRSSERRPPRMPNRASQLVEERVVAFSLGHPGLGPRRISTTLARERWGGILARAWYRVATAAGMPGLRIHDLRRAHATLSPAPASIRRSSASASVMPR
jgi:integrase